MGAGAGLYMYVVAVQKFTFAISSPDEFLYFSSINISSSAAEMGDRLATTDLMRQVGRLLCTFPRWSWVPI